MSTTDTATNPAPCTLDPTTALVQVIPHLEKDDTAEKIAHLAAFRYFRDSGGLNRAAFGTTDTLLYVYVAMPGDPRHPSGAPMRVTLFCLAVSQR